jgi:multimeric flavodoxin WrbA
VKQLLIVYHSQTGNTARLAKAAYAGAHTADVADVRTHILRCTAAGPEDLLRADGLLLGTPENFGYMSGAMKDFFDRTFYPVEGRILALPYALFVAAGNDGSGALRAVRRIANGYPFREVQAPIVAQGELCAAHMTACRDLGTAFALGLSMGVF